MSIDENCVHLDHTEQGKLERIFHDPLNTRQNIIFAALWRIFWNTANVQLLFFSIALAHFSTES